METEKVNVSYERLFNLGNFDHEKISITKQVEAGTELVALKKLSTYIADLEDDLHKFRQIEQDIAQLSDTIRYFCGPEEEKKKWQAHLDEALLKRQAFIEKHKPVSKACKCYYCTHQGDEGE